MCSSCCRDNANQHRLNGRLDIKAFRFKEYGKEAFKAQGVSPDAGFQMALQLAYFRLHGRPPPTYETAQTRKFLRGRTETIRSCSISSTAFVQAWDQADISNKQKAQLFVQATQAHSAYTQRAMNGQGVDRHLFGLRRAASVLGLPVHDFFKDKGYTESTHFRLSTSQVLLQHNA